MIGVFKNAVATIRCCHRNDILVGSRVEWPRRPPFVTDGATKITPRLAPSAISRDSAGSRGPAKLILTMRAPCSSDHSIPGRMSYVVPRAAAFGSAPLERLDREDACLRRNARKFGVGSYDSGNRCAMQGRFRHLRRRRRNHLLRRLKSRDGSCLCPESITATSVFAPLEMA